MPAIIPLRSTGGKATRKQLASRAARRSAPAFDSGLKTSFGPRIVASWYKNSKFSDVTIKYGPDGSLSFDGHRLVLSNSCKWFELSSNPGFLEAEARTITLKDDIPEALEALFEFCYLAQYTPTREGETELQVAKARYLQHACVFVTADKYMADQLADFAAKQLAEHIRACSEEHSYSSAFFKFAVEHIYLHPEVFGLEHDSMEGVEQVTGSEGKDPENASGSTDIRDSEDAEDKNSSTSTTSTITHAGADDTEDFDTGALDALTETTPPHHPLDRLKQIIVNAAVAVWSENSLELGRNRLALLVKRIPQFGVDLAAAALRDGSLTQDGSLDQELAYGGT